MKIEQFSTLSGLKLSGAQNVLESYVAGNYVEMNKWQHYFEAVSRMTARLKKSYNGDWVLMADNKEYFLKDFVGEKAEESSAT